MKSLFWFVFGIVAGFVLSHLVDKDPRGHEVLAEIDARISEFTDRMGDAYRDQEAKFTGPAENANVAVAADSSTGAAPGVAPGLAPTDAAEPHDHAVPTPKDVAEDTTVAQVHAVAEADGANNA